MELSAVSGQRSAVSMATPGIFSRAAGRVASAARPLIGDGLWAAGGQALSVLGVIAGTRVLTEFVPPAVWGEANLALGLATLAASLVSFPLSQALIRYYAEAARQGTAVQLRSVVDRAVRRRALLVLAAAVVAAWACPRFLGVSPLLVVLTVACFWFDSQRTVEISILAAARRQGAFAAWSVLERWSMPAFAVAAICLWGAHAGALLVGNLLALAVAYGLTRNWTRSLVRGDSTPTDASTTWSQSVHLFAWPLVPLAVLEWLSSMGNRWTVGWMLDLESVGLFAAAVGLASQPFLLSNRILELVFKPIYFAASADGDFVRVREVFRTWLLATVVISVGGVGLLTWLAEPLAGLLLGHRYQACVPYVPLIALGYAIVSIGYVYEARCQIGCRTSVILFCRAIGAGSSLVGTLLLTRLLGLAGAAAAPALYFAVQTAASVLLTRKET